MHLTSEVIASQSKPGSQSNQMLPRADRPGAGTTQPWAQLQGEVVNGKFPLQQCLAVSEQTAVFLTERTQQGQKAAIKLVRAMSATADGQLRRWEKAAKVSHPHLLALFEWGRCQLHGLDFLYLLMEYADENLSEVLRSRRLTPAEARDMLPPVLDVLACIHAHGLAHGHVKPANIMAVRDQVKISSDGLCAPGESSSHVGASSAYDPPETATEGLSAAGDVWSLGLTLAEVLTQRLPAWQKGRSGPELPPTIPAPFFDIVRRCLRPNPLQRATVADITHIVAPGAVSLQQPRANKVQQSAEPTHTNISRLPYVLAAVAVGVVVVAMVAGIPRRPQQPPLHVSEPATVVKPSAGIPSSTSPVSAKPAASQPAAGVLRGMVSHKVVPVVPQEARDTIRGTVRVRVRVAVSPDGNVLRATFDAPGPSRYFARKAMQAAQHWKFTPPQVDGQNVASEWLLRFEFQQSSTRAIPTQISD